MVSYLQTLYHLLDVAMKQSFDHIICHSRIDEISQWFRILTFEKLKKSGNLDFS